MYGIDAINAHNGWAMAALGIMIVFTGLVLLSIALSQLHKVLKLWDDRGIYIERLRGAWPKTKEEEPPLIDLQLPHTMKESVRQYKILVDRLGQPFPLPKLLKLAERSGLFRPHSTLNELLQAEVIVPDGKGYFRWSK